MRRRSGVAIAAFAASLALAAAAAVIVWSGHRSARGGGRTTTLAASAPATKHFASGTHANQRLALSLEFDVMDVAGSHSNPRSTKASVDALPPGVQALIWVGNLDNTNCQRPDFTPAQFEALVDAMATDRKVFGYYLSDEPHPLTCTNAVDDIRARADYLHAHSSFQKAFIVIVDGPNFCGGNLGCEYSALRPGNSHVDLVGLDPYPCHYDVGGKAVPCDYRLIGGRVSAATANGIPLSAVVPVFQTFGQKGRTGGGSVYYRLPSTSELTTILDTWKSLVPNPVLDYAYTFGVQCSTTCPAPQALENHPELQPLVRAHNVANRS